MRTFRVLGMLLVVIMAMCTVAYASPNDDLLEAIKKHDLKAVQAALAAGAKPAEAKDATGTYAIDWAAFAGDNEIVKAVIAAGGNVNTPGYLHYTPLIHAAMWSHVDVVKTLLEAKADVSAKDDAGNTALLLASTKCVNKEIIKLLAAAGADLNEKNKLAGTPLLGAVTSSDRDGQLAGAKMMETYGLKPKTLADFSTTAEVVEALVAAGADVNVGDELGRTPLLIALNNKRLDAAKALVASKGFDPKVSVKIKFPKSTVEFIPICKAAELGDLELVKMMLDKGADINANGTSAALSMANDSWGGDGYTPLILSIMMDKLDIANYLLEKGADVNIGSNGWSILSVKGFDKMKCLAKIEKKTPIYWAIDNGDLSLVNKIGEKMTWKYNPFFKLKIMGTVKGEDTGLTKWECKLSQFVGDSYKPSFYANELGRKEVSSALVSKGL